MGVVVAVVSLFVFAGGMKRIAKVTETIVPVMAALYIAGSLIVILFNYESIPYAFHAIFVGAFNPSAITGRAVGATVKLALTKKVWREDFSSTKQVWVLPLTQCSGKGRSSGRAGICGNDRCVY